MDPAELQWLNRFSDHLGHERRLSPHTRQNYLRDLRALADFCAREGVESWSRADTLTIRRFAAGLHRSGLSARSIQRRLSAIRTFYGYLQREQVVTNNPATGVSAPKARKRLPATLDVDSMLALLEFDRDDPLALRDCAIMELLYSSGLRLAELVGLDLDMLDLHDGTVRVTGKGNKTRVLPIGTAARSAVRRWLAIRGNLAAPDVKAVFVSRRGTRLSNRSVQSRLAYWARRKGIDNSVYPHLFRHSFATHLLESSGDLRGVQELLGHANISTTQVYTHLDFQHLAQIYDATHPRAKLKKDSGGA